MPKTNITEALYQYALNIGVKEHPVLEQLRQNTANLTQGLMQISPDQGQFMALLAKILNATKYLDIGVFTGYSSLTMALAMKDNGIVYALDNNAEYLEIAEQSWTDAGVRHKIKPFLNNAIDSLRTLALTDANSFDITFIDANKSDYITYYEYAYKLARIGGLILIDNVFMAGKVLETKQPKYVDTIKELNHLIYNDSRVDICVLPIADGLTLAYKK